MALTARMPLVEGQMPRFANGADLTDFGSYVELTFWVTHALPGHGTERVIVGEPITMTAEDFNSMVHGMLKAPLLAN